MDQNDDNRTGEDAGGTVGARRDHSTERVRVYRRRRKAGLRPITVEIFEFEIDVLVRCGLLHSYQRDDTRVAIPVALEKVIGAAVRALDRGELEVNYPSHTRV